MTASPGKRNRISFPKIDLPPGARKVVVVGRRELAVFNVGGEIYCVFNRCPHHRAPLVAGTVSGTNLPSAPGKIRRGLEGRVLFCPWHHYEFELDTGRCLGDPRLRVAIYRVEVEGDEIALYV